MESPPGVGYWLATLGASLQSTLSEMLALVPDWILNVGQSLIVLALGWALARYLSDIFGRRVANRFRRPSLTRTATRGVRLIVFAFAFLTVLRIYGFGLGNIALSLTVFTAVLGVVLAPIVGSFISGVFLLADQPYEIGDMVEIVDTGQRGFVEDITIRYTKIFTLDNTFLVVPNGEMRNRDVMNYSAEDRRTRRTLKLLVTYESDVHEARRIMERSARRVEEIIEGGPDIRVGAARYPAPPTCYVDEYADHGVLLNLRYWVKEPYKLLTIRSKINREIWSELDDADVEIAYPHSHLIFDETSGDLSVSVAGGQADLGRPAPERSTAESPSPGDPRRDPDPSADE
jgi:small-conductance mechanosensitive channel